MIDDSDLGLEHLNDFAVMVLFSIFESIVRNSVLNQVERERETITQELPVGLINASLRDFRKKSFHGVLEVFKGMDAGLVEEVNQVRRYRNWVAHGRQSAAPNSVDPEAAYKRLRRFLEVMTQE